MVAGDLVDVGDCEAFNCGSGFVLNLYLDGSVGGGFDVQFQTVARESNWWRGDLAAVMTGCGGGGGGD